jgi:hypothetical protein
MFERVDDQELNDDGLAWAHEREAAIAPQKSSSRGSVPASANTSSLASLASLLLGTATEGGEQLSVRLRQWQAAAELRGDEFAGEPPHENDTERIRYALVGLMALAPGKAQRGFSAALRASDVVYVSVSDWVAPLTNSRAARPFRIRYDRLAARGERMVENWIDAGRVAEQQGRALARQAAVDGTDEAMDEVIGIMATKPAVRELVTQQGLGMADEAVSFVRVRTARADNQWEQRIRSLFRLK